MNVSIGSTRGIRALKERGKNYINALLTYEILKKKHLNYDSLSLSFKEFILLLYKVVTWFLLLISTFYLVYCITAWYKYLGEYKTIYIYCIYINPFKNILPLLSNHAFYV